MTEQEFFFSNYNRKKGWYGIIIMIILLILLFFLVKSIFSLLYYLSPLLIILTLIFDYKVVIKFGKWLWKLLRENILYGVLVIALGILAFPILAGGLFVNAFMNWRLKRMKKRFAAMEDQPIEKFTKFELLDEEELGAEQADEQITDQK